MIQRKRTKERKQLKMEAVCAENQKDNMTVHSGRWSENREVAGNSFCFSQPFDFLKESLETAKNPNLYWGNKIVEKMLPHTEYIGLSKMLRTLQRKDEQRRRKPKEFSQRPRRALEEYAPKEFQKDP